MNIDKCVALLFAVLLATTAGCDATIQEEHETDAQLSCREEGYDIDSDAYNDCVENWTGSN